jgi:hypothetical protein
MHFDATDLVKRIKELIDENNFSVITNGGPFINEVSEVHILRGSDTKTHRVLICTITQPEREIYLFNFAPGANNQDKTALELLIIALNLD